MVSNPRHLGFSLVELIVVIAVVSLLVGVLLPVIGEARSQARTARCLSNQRQASLALQLYTHDYEGRLVTYAYKVPGGTVWWFGFEKNGVGASGKRPIDTTRSPLAPYFNGDILEGLACPDFPESDGRFHKKFEKRSAHFVRDVARVLDIDRSDRRIGRRVVDLDAPAGVGRNEDAPARGRHTLNDRPEVGDRLGSRLAGGVVDRHRAVARREVALVPDEHGRGRRDTVGVSAALCIGRRIAGGEQQRESEQKEQAFHRGRG